jgi:hypothetical protein
MLVSCGPERGCACGSMRRRVHETERRNRRRRLPLPRAAVWHSLARGLPLEVPIHDVKIVAGIHWEVLKPR